MKPPKVKAGIEGVIGGKLVLIGEKGPPPPPGPPPLRPDVLIEENGRGGGIVIREGATAF